MRSVPFSFGVAPERPALVVLMIGAGSLVIASQIYGSFLDESTARRSAKVLAPGEELALSSLDLRTTGHSVAFNGRGTRASASGGMLVVGLGGSGDPVNIQDDGTLHFHSCNVASGGAGLGHLVPLPGAWWVQF